MMEGTGFRPYEAYRESGLDWIGSIPSTWDVQRAKWLFKRMDRAVRPDDDIVTCFAVIIDEAHSSQSGSAHDTMNRAMGKDPDEDDTQDVILKAMIARKMRGNASYLAFTATPKNTTLEKFGVKQADGSFEPFHLYSMKQAIEEGFILDVLANYTTYKSYYEIAKSIEDNPLFDTKKAQKKLRAYVERSQQTISTKADIMLDHFIPSVVNAKKLRG